MKKLFYSLLTVLLATAVYAQPNPDDLFISGYVTASGGGAVNGQQVCVYADTTNQQNFYFYECATTNSNGYYYINVPNGSLTGPNITFNVYTLNCNNTSLDTAVINGQGSINSHNVDFTVCQSSLNCQASYTWSNGIAGSIFFTYTGTTDSGQSYHWDFGDGSTSSLQNPSHTYNSSGPWGVTLVISTTIGCTSTAYDTVYGGTSNLCNPSFTYATTPNGSAVFTYTGSSNPGQTYTWSFGDGTASSQANPTHYYNGGGPYVACVTIHDSLNSCNATFCDTVNFVNTGFCHAGFSVSIDSSNSGIYVITLHDQSVGNVVAYDWWVDGASYTSSTVVHTYQGTGAIGVCLSIQTADSCNSSSCDTLYLGTGGNSNCHAYFQYSNNPNGGTQFYGSSGLNNASYYWDFGDGATSSTQNPSHVFSGNGTYTVCLTVAETNGNCTSTYCDTVTVGNNTGGCHANFVAVPDSLTLPPFPSNGYFFYDQSTGSPSYWHWDFGDNTTSNQANPGHVYANPGTYTVCLTVANFGSNCYDTYCSTIVVNGNNNGNCHASYTYSSSVNGGITFYGASGQNSAQYVWSFGDGSSGSGQTVNHAYNAPGTYTVCLTVYGSNSCTDTYCQQVSYGNNTSNYCISGTVNLGTLNQVADYGLVYLITFNSQTNQLVAVDTTSIDSSGFYYFCNIQAGQYLVKAALSPNSSSFSGYLPTYYGNSLFWDYAQSVTLSPSSGSQTANITLIAGNNTGGPGFIGGDVTQGANKTGGPGDPIANVQVMILDINDNPVAYSYTNGLGNFQFPGLAYGTYKVYAEVPGLPTYPAYVTLDANNESVSGVHIYQSSTELSTGVIELGNNKFVKISDIYPNPTNGDAFISFELMDNAAIDIHVFSATGQLVSSQAIQLGSGANQVEIETDRLNQGLYFVQFTEQSGQFKFNKQMVVSK